MDSLKLIIGVVLFFIAIWALSFIRAFCFRLIEKQMEKKREKELWGRQQ
jgi:hypothetical protein